jgi:cation transport regulator ChaC
LTLLDERESGGYERRWLEVETDARTLEVLTYIASMENANFLGEVPLADVVEQVLMARGQSGDNVAYVLELERALASLSIVDAHVRELAEALRERLESPDR